MTEESCTHLTYSELERQARAVAARLQQTDAMGERVLLLYSPGLDYIVAFWGCLYAGAIAVPVYPPRRNRPSPRLAAIVEDAQAKFVLTDGATHAEAARLSTHTPALTRLHWLATDELRDDEAAAWVAPAIHPDSTAFLQYTSGSTATPKGVILSHANLLHNSSLIQAAFGTTSQSCGVIWLPPYHDMGLIGGILQPLVGGFPVVLMAPMAFLQKPYFWLKTISDYQATVSGGPNFAYDLCIEKISPAQRATLDLSHWQVAFNGAEPIRAATLTRFAETFAPCGFRYKAFYPCYGLAEGTLIAAGGDHTVPPIVCTVAEAPLAYNQVVVTADRQDGSRPIVSSGRALQGQRLVIADPERRNRCAPDEVGEIWVAGPSVAQGYWQQPESSAATFQGYLADGDGPFLRTGDLGFLQDGELYVTGRLKDLIIIRGRNYYPQDIELTVEQSHPALRPGNGAAFAVEVDGVEQVVVAQEIQAHYRHNAPVEEIAAAVRQALAEQHELQAHAVLLLRTGSIPKTSSGKIQRHACRNGWRDHTLALVGESTRAPTVPAGRVAASESDDAPLVALQREVARVLRLAPAQIEPHQPLNRLGVDSLAAVELAQAVEARWGLAISMVDILDGLTLAQIASELDRAVLDPSHEADSAPPRQPVPRHQAPLSAPQQRLWFLERLVPGNAAYHVAVAVQVRGALDVALLRDSLNAVIARHATLRTTFHSLGGVPVQQILPICEIEVPVIESQDASTWPAFVHRRARIEAASPFDLERGPLVRATLLRQHATHHVLFLTLHHIITDGWSMGVLAREVISLYTASLEGQQAPLPPLAWEYSDALEWQQGRLQSPPVLDPLRTYWAHKLAGLPPLLELPTDHPRPPAQTFNGGQVLFAIPQSLRGALQAVALAYETTLFTVLLAALKVLFRLYTRRDDMVVGTSVANRTHRASQPLIGLFVNQLVLRTDLNGTATFAEILRRVRQTTLEAFKHQELPFDQVVELVRAERSPQYNPLFQTNFVLENAPLPALSFGGLELSLLDTDTGAAPFDLSLLISEDGTGLKGAFRYNRHLFEPDTISRWAHQYRGLLQFVAGHPTAPLPDAEGWLTPPDDGGPAEGRLRIAHEKTGVAFPRNKTIHQLFAEQAQRTPHQPAVTFQGQTLTFAELDGQANQLAHYLVSLGVGPEARVGLYLTRSVAQIVGLLAVLKAGGAYVPLDPTYPQARLAFLLGDARPQVVLTEAALQPTIPPSSAEILALDAIGAELATLPTTPPAVPIDPQNLAYLLYTSGSTGQPKGVMVQHRSVVNLATALQDAIYQVWGRGLRVSVNAPLVFDGSVKQWIQLLNGHTLCIVPEEVRTDAAKLVAFVAHQALDVLDCTPSLLKKLLPAGLVTQTSLQGVLVGGEALDAPTWDQLAASQRVDFVNVYGPTEATVDATVCLVRHAPPHPAIGHPIANVRVYLLDEQLHPVHDGERGELYLGGAGLARGYWGNPALTAARFVPDPYSPTPGARLYRTGDLARWRSETSGFEYLGRTDDQVQVQGVRVELGEVEAVLNAHALVQAAAVAVSESTPGDAHLVAYVVPAAKPPDLIARLRADLRQQLPLALMPRYVVPLDSLPLTPSGKLDRQALPAPDTVAVEAQPPVASSPYSAPRSGMERQIAEIWQAVLGVEKVGLHDNFWDLGGHSLLLVQAFDRLQSATGKTLSLVEFYRHPTVSTLADYLTAGQEAAGGDAVPALDARVEKQKAALERQRRLAGKRNKQV